MKPIDEDEDRRRMREALEESRKSKPERGGRLQPLVGAVLVLGDGQSFKAHRGEIADGDHAEFTLLERKLRDRELRDATLYVTLEPCTARSSHKPCAERIIARGIGRVVIGALDPDPRIYQRGLRMLLEAGVKAALIGGDVSNEILASQWDWSEAHKRRRRRGTAIASALVGVPVISLLLWITILQPVTHTVPLGTPRASLAAAALPDGRVIIAGGQTSAGPTGAAVMFVSHLRPWRELPSMRHPRRGARALALDRDRVLVIGGEDGRDIPTNEIFDSARNEWQEAPGLRKPRSGHWVGRFPNGEVVVVGGTSTSQPREPLPHEIMRDRDRTWVIGTAGAAEPENPCIVMSSKLGVVKLGGSVDGRTVATASALHSAAESEWRALPPMSVPRVLAACIELATGDILVSGGSGVDGDTPVSAEILRSSGPKWEAVGRMMKPRFGHLLAVRRNGGAIAVGGSGPGAPEYRLSELFDSQTLRWTDGPELSVGRTMGTYVSLPGNRILLLGGQDHRSQAVAELVNLR